MLYDVLIIGGGAAGLCAAIKIKQNNPKLSVVITEQLPRVGKKLITTGNGRCNITNRKITAERYHGENVQFCTTALKKYDITVTENFFKKIGVVFSYDETGRAYPYSLQASSVVDALRFTAESLGVVTHTETEVCKIVRSKNGYIISTNNGEFKARTLIVAAGLYSGGEKLGSTGKIMRIMRDDLGYKTVKVTPAIVQIKTQPETVRALKGIKVNATASLVANGKVLRQEYGEVLFCDYGLSGPPILQLSRAVERENRKLEIKLDIMPEYDISELCGLLKERISDLSSRTLEEFFTGMLNKRVGQTILKNCGFRLSDAVSVLKGCEEKLALEIKQMTFCVTATTGFLNSQVTAGGLDTTQFNPNTMMSLKDKGLFAAGEILDIDGDCGGFNLQWAWSSAFTAADSVCDFLKFTENL